MKYLMKYETLKHSDILAKENKLANLSKLFEDIFRKIRKIDVERHERSTVKRIFMNYGKISVYYSKITPRLKIEMYVIKIKPLTEEQDEIIIRIYTDYSTEICKYFSDTMKDFLSEYLTNNCTIRQMSFDNLKMFNIPLSELNNITETINVFLAYLDGFKYNI